MKCSYMLPQAISKVTAAILAVSLLYLFPAYQAAEKEEDIRQLTSYNLLVEFTDAVRTKGYISAGMYRDFTQEIGLAGGVYDIEMEHQHKKYHPEYSDPADAATFQNTFSIVYDSYYTKDILNELFPESTSIPPGSIGDRKYYLQTRDYISITITDRSRSMYDVLTDFMYSFGQNSRAQGKDMTYGGMVLNEDY